MKRTIVVSIMWLLSGGPLLAQGRSDQVITVTGHGTASAMPDVAEVEMTVGVVAGTADSSLALAAQTVQAVLDSIAGLGLGEVDFVTTQFRLQPGRTHPRTGDPIEHRVQNSFTVRIHGAGSITDAIHAALRAADVQIGAVRFRVEDEAELRRRALAAAIEDGRRKAQLIAEDLGARLGELLRADAAEEQTVAAPIMAPSRWEPAGQQAVRTPIRSDAATASARLTLRFAIER